MTESDGKQPPLWGRGNAILIRAHAQTVTALPPQRCSPAGRDQLAGKRNPAADLSPLHPKDNRPVATASGDTRIPLQSRPGRGGIRFVFFTTC